MICSMTGFGDAAEQVEGIHYAVELRSLNNRYFKASIRLPETLAGLEAELEMQLRKRLHRGSITLTVGMRDGGTLATHQINEPALLAYLNHLDAIHARLSVQNRQASLDLTALLSLPGVLEAADEEAALRQAGPVVRRLLDRACDKLLTMRQTEGATIVRDLEHHRQVIKNKLTAIQQRAPLVIEEYHQRLKSRVDELLKRAELNVNQVDLIREVAVFAERADIAEEISRLAAHLDQMATLLQETDGEPAGRTLEFLAQEMLREANTIASKSNDAQISRPVVEVKSAIDRIKEQSQNVE